MADRNTLEFFVYSGGSWRSARAAVPADWYGNWHRVAGSYDGTTVRLFIDGTQVGQLAWTGVIDTFRPYPVDIGRNAETGQEMRRTRTSAGAIDNVRIYHAALTPERLATDPTAEAVLFTEAAPGDARAGKLTVTNEKRFSGTDGVQVRWRVEEVGRTVASGTRPLRLGPGAAGPVPLDIDVTGAQVLRLRVTDAGDGNALDHADWAAATLSCTP